MSTAPPVTVSFYRHGEIASHRGDVPLTERGVHDAERAGEHLAELLDRDTDVSFLHAPTRRTLETLEALRRGAQRTLPHHEGVQLAAPRLEPAIRNPDLYVAGIRVEMVSSADALAAQLPAGLLTPEEVAGNAFFRRFWSQADRIRVWLDDDDPPGERCEDVARRFFTFARSLTEPASERPRHYVCVTHSGPMRAILRKYVLDEDPGEPAYAEPIHARFAAGSVSWHFREAESRARLA